METRNMATVEEAAKYLGVSIAQVGKYVRGETQNKLRAVKWQGRWLIPRTALKEYRKAPPGNPAVHRHRKRKK